VLRQVTQDLTSDGNLECVADRGVRRDPDEAELREGTGGKPSNAVEPSPSHTMVLVVRPEQGDQQVDVQKPGHRKRSISSAFTARLVRRGAPFGGLTTGNPFLRRTTFAP
jgi:hypothetical protein